MPNGTFLMKNRCNYNLVLTFSLIILFSLLVRMIFLEAPLESDDTLYMAHAESYSKEMLLKTNSQLPFRLGMILPLCILQYFFSYSIISYYVFSITMYILVVISIFIASNYFISQEGAIVSSLIASTSSFILFQTSNVLPDAPNLVFLLSSYILFYQSCINKNKEWIYLVLSAIMAFISYLIRLPNIVFLICIIIFDILQNHSVKKSIIFVNLFLLCIILEVIYYWIYIGKPFERFLIEPNGVYGWVRFMNEISFKSYLLDPIKAIALVTSGKILLLSGLLGLITSFYKKKWGIFSLSIGASILFIAYSYSFTSFNPIVRALPLQRRYIIAFSAIMILNAAFVFIQIYNNICEKIWKRKALYSFLALFIIFQIAELRHEISNSIIFKKTADDYFVGDRLLADKIDQFKKQDKVYAYPIRDFKMYPNFSQLNLYPLPYGQIPKKNDFFLISKKRIKLDNNYSSDRNNKNVINTTEYWLDSFHPNWEYIIDEGNIIFGKVKQQEPIWQLCIDLVNNNEMKDQWYSDRINIKYTEMGIELCKINENYPKASYIYTFAGPWDYPPKLYKAIFKQIEGKKSVKFSIRYKNMVEVDSITFFINSYDDEKKIESISYNIPSASGLNYFSKVIKIDNNTKSFKLFFRFLNRNKLNTINIEELKISSNSLENF
jgi:hypothetical protein